MFNHVPIKHKQMSFVSNGGKFKLYTVPNGLLFPKPTQPRFSFERMLSVLADLTFFGPFKKNLQFVSTLQNKKLKYSYFLRFFLE
jgi:hypothetical protein